MPFRSCTVTLVFKSELFVVRTDPFGDVYVVANERRDLTLEYRCVPADRENVVHLDFEILGYGCNENISD